VKVSVTVVTKSIKIDNKSPNNHQFKYHENKYMKTGFIHCTI